MNRKMENLVSSCLDQLEQGIALDTILGGYPAESDNLRPYLETAAQVTQLASQPTLDAQQKSRQQFLAQAAAMRDTETPIVPAWYSLRRLLLPVASLAAILLLLGLSLISLSASALPGESLYPFKRSLEDLRLTLSSNPQQILELSARFQEERLHEIELLLLSGREADVSYEGQIQAINLTNWMVSGLTVRLDDDVLIEGRPQIGEIAKINGYTANGSLFASHISVLTGRPDPEPTLLPTPTATTEASATPTATREEPTRSLPAAGPLVISPTATASPTPTATEDTPTPTMLSPVETAPPPPTATAVPDPGANDNDDNGGSNEDEGENDNGDTGLGNNNDDDGGDDNSGDDNSGDGDNDNEGENNNGSDDNDNDDDDDDNGGGDDDDNDNDDDGGGDDDDNDNDDDGGGDDEDAGNDNDGDEDGD